MEKIVMNEKWIGVQAPFIRIDRDDSFGLKGYHGKYHYIYFGQFNDKPIKWRILSIHGNDGTYTDGQKECLKPLFLLSDAYLEEKIAYSETLKGNWPESDALKWCNDMYHSPNYFNDVEKTAILSTKKWDDKWCDEHPMYYPAVHLTGETIFFLSVAELNNKQYGFGNGGYYDQEPTRIAYDQFGDNPLEYWTRSNHSMGPEGAVCINVIGRPPAVFADAKSAVRPALNLNVEKIFFTMPATSTTALTLDDNKVQLKNIESYDERNEAWTLTLFDESRNNFQAILDRTNFQLGDEIKIRFMNAKEGENEYVSAMLVDETFFMDSKGFIVSGVQYYGHIAYNKVSGKVNVSIPSEMKPGRYKLLVFSQKSNDVYISNYVSKAIDFDITVAVTLTPVLENDTVLKEVNGQNSVSFKLQKNCHYDPKAIWRVYIPVLVNDLYECKNKLKVTCNESTLTLSNISPISTGSYYISVEEPGKNESDKTKIEIKKPETLGLTQLQLDKSNNFGISGYNTNRLYFGRLFDRPIKWKILSTNGNGGTYYNDDHAVNQALFIQAEGHLGETAMNKDRTVFWKKDDHTQSDALKWCENLYKNPSVFCNEERATILSTHKANDQNILDYYYTDGNEFTGVPLTGEKLFFLSAEELMTTRYGFQNLVSVQPDPNRMVERFSGRKPIDCLTRSYVTCQPETICAQTRDGRLCCQRSYVSAGARPGMNLDMNNILFSYDANLNDTLFKQTSKAFVAIDSRRVEEWHIVLKESSSQQCFVTLDKTAIENKIVLDLHISNLKQSENEYVMVILLDENKKPLYMTTISTLKICDNKIRLMLPDALSAGSYKVNTSMIRKNDQGHCLIGSDFQCFDLSV